MAEGIKTIPTTRGELRYYQDWDKYEGGIVMLNPQTIERYCKLADTHPNVSDYNCFFAFRKESFKAGYDALVRKGVIAEGDKLCSHPSGLIGRREDIDAVLDFYDHINELQKNECDPQEVYFYEYNNHECMLAWDGDLEAIRLVISLWGEDVASKIVRYSDSVPVDKAFD